MESRAEQSLSEAIDSYCTRVIEASEKYIDKYKENPNKFNKKIAENIYKLSKSYSKNDMLNTKLQYLAKVLAEFRKLDKKIKRATPFRIHIGKLVGKGGQYLESLQKFDENSKDKDALPKFMGLLNDYLREKNEKSIQDIFEKSLTSIDAKDQESNWYKAFLENRINHEDQFYLKKETVTKKAEDIIAAIILITKSPIESNIKEEKSESTMQTVESFEVKPKHGKSEEKHESNKRDWPSEKEDPVIISEIDNLDTDQAPLKEKIKSGQQRVDKQDEINNQLASRDNILQMRKLAASIYQITLEYDEKKVVQEMESLKKLAYDFYFSKTISNKDLLIFLAKVVKLMQKIRKKDEFNIRGPWIEKLIHINKNFFNLAAEILLTNEAYIHTRSVQSKNNNDTSDNKNISEKYCKAHPEIVYMMTLLENFLKVFTDPHSSPYLIATLWHNEYATYWNFVNKSTTELRTYDYKSNNNYLHFDNSFFQTILGSIISTLNDVSPDIEHELKAEESQSKPTINQYSNSSLNPFMFNSTSTIHSANERMHKGANENAMSALLQFQRENPQKPNKNK